MSNDEMNEHWEARINALLDGELDEQEAAAFKREAGQNESLAQAIIEAYALQSALEQLQIERAPASLRSRLARIPKTEKAGSKRWLGMPRWVPAGAFAAIPLAVIAMVMMSGTPEKPDYSQAEILQARQDVITALAYLDRVGERTGLGIKGQLSKEFSNGVSDNVAKHMPFAHKSEQEEKS
jgi:anti-sigma factor RsiW